MNIGVIGAGNIANKFCDAVNKGNLDAKLWAIGSRSINKAKSFKDKHHIHKAYGAYDDLYADSNVDLVYIAIPHAYHFQEMKAAIENNKHILCEKPMTLNAKQAEIIFDLAKQKNIFVMEALWTRFLPVIQRLKQDIDNDIIGSIKYLTASFCIYPNKDMNDRLYQSKLGGGALLDVGIYPITMANIFLGRPSSITSKVTKMKTGVDGSETITYHYSDASALLTSAINKKYQVEGIIEGTKGTAVIDGLHDTESAKIYDLNGNLIKHIHIPFEVNGFEYEIKEVIHCIKNNDIESKIHPHEETIAILKQMDTLRKDWKLIYPQEKNLYRH